MRATARYARAFMRGCMLIARSRSCNIACDMFPAVRAAPSLLL